MKTEYVSNLEVLAYMLARELSDGFLEMAREGAGNTNIAVVKRKRDTLLAFLQQENNDDDDSQPSDFRQPV